MTRRLLPGLLLATGLLALWARRTLIASVALASVRSPLGAAVPPLGSLTSVAARLRRCNPARRDLYRLRLGRRPGRPIRSPRGRPS